MTEKQKHSPFGASSAYRWFACPGSIRMTKDLPEQPTSQYALEGTVAHELAEACLQQSCNATDLIDGDFSQHNVPITEEMCEAVQIYLDAVREEWKEGTELLLEHKFHLDFLHEDLYGTNDACVKEPFGKLTVFDYKHGAGIPVEVEANKQLLYYALGAAYDGDFSEIEIVIVQPRAPHKDGPIRRWSVSPDYLLDKWVDDLLDAVADAEEENAALNPGDHCRFCAAQPTCPALRKRNFEMAKLEFDDMVVPKEDKVNLPSPESLSPADLVRVLEASKLIDSWLKAVVEYAHDRAEKGEQLPGYKLVNKRANRKWVNDSEVVLKLKEKFGENIFAPRKLKTPAQMEKVVEKKVVADLCHAPPSGTVLVPLSDKREPVKPEIETAFDKPTKVKK